MVCLCQRSSGRATHDNEDNVTDCINFEDENDTVDSFDVNDNNPFCNKEGSFQSQVSQKPSLCEKNSFEFSLLTRAIAWDSTVGCQFYG